MFYKGYTGVLEVDEDAGELFGTVIGTRDGITFVGKTVAEARASFEQSVNFYLERCAATGKQPDRPFSGKFNVRISPDLHRRLASIAHAIRISLNDLVVRALSDHVATYEVADEDDSDPGPAPVEPSAGHSATKGERAGRAIELDG